MEFIPERWGIVGFNDATGLGRQATDCRNVLGLGWHFVKPSERLETMPLKDSREILLSNGACSAAVEQCVAQVDGLIFLETPFSHNGIRSVAERLRKKLVLVPNWEWFPGIRRKQCQRFDLFVAPTKYTRKWIKRFFLGPVAVAPPTLDLDQLAFRHITGPARTFIHNAGIIDENDRKGTQATLEAFRKTSNTDVKLIVRAQKTHPLLSLYEREDRIQIQSGNLESHSDLYAVGDVCIQPSRMEGIGYQIIEAIVSGMPVLTSDTSPMNEWLPEKSLLCDVHWGWNLPKSVRLSTFQSHLRSPKVTSLADRIDSLARCNLSPLSDMCLEVRDKVFSKRNIFGCFEKAIGQL